MTSPLGNLQAQSSVDVSDSCNCTYCCPRACCLPIGRKVKKEKCKHEGDVEVTTTTMKAHGVSQAHLSKSGKWDIEIDGKKHAADEITE